MSSLIEIRQAVPEDAETVSGILTEVALWQEQLGAPLWLDGELIPQKIGVEIRSGLFFLAEYAGEPAGTVRFQFEDQLFWPDAPNPGAVYVHRLAVRRLYTGKGISTALLAWAAERTHCVGRRFLRLDCDADRPKLRAIYESFGFRHHSYRQVGSYFVARYELDVACTRGIR
ncbi:MAG: GNAT family N-acetyltransferase [Candidatus Acidiferrales bacterium]